MLESDEDGADPDVSGDPETNLAASAVSGQTPPAGPQWVSRLSPFELRPDGLVRITLKKAYTDGTLALDMDPLSLLCRLVTSVPPPRFRGAPPLSRARSPVSGEPRAPPGSVSAPE